MNFNSSFYLFEHFNPMKWCNTGQYTFLEQYKVLRKGIGFTELPQIRKTTHPLLLFFLDTMRIKLQYNTWTKSSASPSVWEILRLRQHRLWNRLANIPAGERGIESWLFLAQDCMKSPHIVSESLPPTKSFCAHLAVSNKSLAFYPPPVKAQQHCQGFRAIFPHYVQSNLGWQGKACSFASPCGTGALSHTPKGLKRLDGHHKGLHLLWFCRDVVNILPPYSGQKPAEKVFKTLLNIISRVTFLWSFWGAAFFS